MRSFTALVLLTVLLFALVACGDSSTGLPGQPSTGGSGDASASPAAPTAPFTPIPVPPTPTPPPPPPTPTPRPKPTDAPTKPPEPTKAGETVQPTATPPPAAGVDTPMIDIPAGTYSIGSESGTADSKPPHNVDLAAYSIDQLEVTNADFKAFVDATSYKTDAEKGGDSPWSKFAEGKANHPVVKVSWNDAKAFCEWTGKRLPTEAEWEVAARGKEGFAFPYGNTFDPKKQNGKETGIRGTTAGGSYPEGASPFQVLDMAGNVWEWTSDVAKPYPGNTTQSKLYGDNLYILRGGGWFDVQEQLASHYRNSATAPTANDDLGFRCAK